jgi:hypothetical protein
LIGATKGSCAKSLCRLHSLAPWAVAKLHELTGDNSEGVMTGLAVRDDRDDRCGSGAQVMSPEPKLRVEPK